MSDEMVEMPAEETEAVVAEVAPEEAPVVVEEAEEEPKRRSRKVVESAPENKAVEVPVKAVNAPVYPAMALTSGAWSEALCVAQKRMGVAETGIMDADTKNAVKAVQKKSGMKADGHISAVTWAKIFS